MSKDNTKLPLKRALTQDKMSAHNAKAFLITCMDFRFINDEISHMLEKGYDVNFDAYSMAGVSIGINQTEYPYWVKTLFDHIEISVNLHHIKKVILFDHLDCGAYKKFRPGFKTEQEERDLHVEELKIAAAKIKEKFKDLKIVCKIIHSNRKVEKVYVLK